MITISSVRFKGREQFPPIVYEQAPLEALIRLMVYELALGGEVVSTTPRQINVRTNVLGCIDVTDFEGGEEEMRPLLLAVYYYLSISKTHGLEMLETSFRQLERSTGGKGVNTLLLANLGPILSSMAPAYAAMFLAVGITDKADLKAAMKLADRDIQPVIELRQENPGVPLAEILQLVRQ